MRYSVSIAAAICSLFVLASTAAPAQQADGSAAPGGPPVLRATFPTGHAPRVADGTWTDRVVGFPGENTQKVALRLAVPSFSSSVVARGKLYKFTMVGSNPFLRNAKKVTIPVQVIPVRFDFPDGTVLDPAAPGPSCAGGGTPLQRTLESPLFQ